MKVFELRYWPLRKIVPGFRGPPTYETTHSRASLDVCGEGSAGEFCFGFYDKVSLCRPGCAHTHHLLDSVS